MPNISVIVPVYKVEPWLRRCVDSILAQTYTDYEVILVDDGSPDDCGAICDEYAARDARVHVIHQENGGLSAARNAGIDWAFQNSESQWLSFIDSDDWVHPQYLELLYRAAAENGVQISICDYQRVDSEEPAPPASCGAEVLTWEEMLYAHNIPGVIACAKLYEKELFRGYRYPVGKLHEDEYLTYKLLFLAQNVAYLQAALYNYYENTVGITLRTFSLKRLDALPALKERLAFVRLHGSKRLFHNDLIRCLKVCARDGAALQSAEYIDPALRKRTRRLLRRTARRLILRYGWRTLPPRRYKKYYFFAFPYSMRLIRKVLVLGRRLAGSAGKSPR